MSKSPLHRFFCFNSNKLNVILKLADTICSDLYKKKTFLTFTETVRIEVSTPSTGLFYVRQQSTHSHLQRQHMYEYLFISNSEQEYWNNSSARTFGDLQNTVHDELCQLRKSKSHLYTIYSTAVSLTSEILSTVWQRVQSKVPLQFC